MSEVTNETRAALGGLRRERDALARQVTSLKARRERLSEKPVRDAARKARFLSRLDREIRDAEERLSLVNANIEGIEEACEPY